MISRANCFIIVCILRMSLQSLELTLCSTIRSYPVFSQKDSITTSHGNTYCFSYAAGAGTAYTEERSV